MHATLQDQVIPPFLFLIPALSFGGNGSVHLDYPAHSHFPGSVAPSGTVVDLFAGVADISVGCLGLFVGAVDLSVGAVDLSAGVVGLSDGVADFFLE